MMVLVSVSPLRRRRRRRRSRIPECRHLRFSPCIAVDWLTVRRGNVLSSLPINKLTGGPELDKCKSLETLDLTGNRLGRWSSSIGRTVKTLHSLIQLSIVVVELRTDCQRNALVCPLHHRHARRGSGPLHEAQAFAGSSLSICFPLQRGRPTMRTPRCCRCLRPLWTPKPTASSTTGALRATGRWLRALAARCCTRQQLSWCVCECACV